MYEITGETIEEVRALEERVTNEPDSMTIPTPLEEVIASQKRLEQKFDEILELVTHIKDVAAPALEAFQKSPISKMLGGF